MRLTGPENIGPERTLPRLLALRPVNSSTRITPENNGKIRPQPDRENAFARASGGETGIRTLGRRKPTTVFETAAFDHSATSPQQSWGAMYPGRFGCASDNLAALRPRPGSKRSCPAGKVADRRRVTRTCAGGSWQAGGIALGLSSRGFAARLLQGETGWVRSGVFRCL